MMWIWRIIQVIFFSAVIAWELSRPKVEKIRLFLGTPEHHDDEPILTISSTKPGNPGWLYCEEMVRFAFREYGINVMCTDGAREFLDTSSP